MSARIFKITLNHFQ